MTRTRKKSEHYVDNKKFLWPAMIDIKNVMRKVSKKEIERNHLNKLYNECFFKDCKSFIL